MKSILSIRRLSWLPLLLIGTIGAASAAQGELWETRSSMSSPEFGKMELGVNRACQRPEWRDNPEFEIPGDHGECQSRNIERRGDGYVWSFACGDTTGEGQVHRKGQDRLDANMQMNTPEGRFALTMQSRRVGHCELD